MWKKNRRMRKGGSFWRSGDFNRICDMSGFKVKASQTMKTWDGFIVRKEDWEARHPQDFLTGTVDKIKVDDARPESENVFLTATEVKAEDL
jgi:hypothetical protein